MNITPIEPLFDKLAATVAPLALFSIGLQLQFRGWYKQWKHISVALAYKLIIAPLLVLIVSLVFNLKGIVPQICVFEAAMPTVLTAAVITDEYGLNPVLSNQIIGLGIIASFFTTGAWYAITQWLL